MTSGYPAEAKDTSGLVCRICGNESGNKTHTTREMMFGTRDEFDYLECSQCKCLQIIEIPATMSKYYRDEYHSFAPLRHHNRVRRFLSSARDNYALTGRGVLGRLLSRRFPSHVPLQSLSHLHLDPSARILDVGCGAGMLLNALRDLGFSNLVGVDPFLSGDIQYGNGVKLYKKTIHQIEGEFDLIMFHHSFEHLADPEATLKAVHELLAASADCIVRIPTVTSYAWKHYGTNWVQLDAPRHFFLHSQASMKILAEEAELELSEVAYDSSAFQFWASEQYALDIPLYDDRSYAVSPNASYFTKEQIAAFEKRARQLNHTNLGDQAAFYLKKPKRGTRPQP